MDKTTALNNLFADWKDKNSSGEFAKDGIVNESLWEKASNKILYIMEETNDYAGDVRELVNKYPWRVEGYWAYGLLNSNFERFPTFADAKKDENWKEACKSIAIINLKKVPGGSNSDMKEIEDYAKKDKEKIIEELKIINPEIILCCATFNVIKKVFDFDFSPNLDPDGKCFNYGNKIWIDYCHPGARFRHDMMYYTLMKFYQNAHEKVSS